MKKQPKASVSSSLVVDECLRFHKRMEKYPHYQAANLVFWRRLIAAGEHPYCGAYSATFRKLGLSEAL